MANIIPNKLTAGDEVRVIAPVRSLALISKESREIANQRFNDLGLKLSFGKHAEEVDDFSSTSIESRIEDLHSAFQDPNVKAIFTVIGGFNSNQLFRHIDWDLIKNNPKIFCGFSDVTALNNAFLAKTGLVSYSGPHYSSLGQKLYVEYTLDYLKQCLFSDQPINVRQSSEWSDDPWYLDQDKRNLISNKGWLVVNEGETSGTIVGGNLCTFNLLQGTEYFPNLENTVLFIEDDAESQPHHFDRDLQSLIHLPNFSGVKGLVIGRFQNESNMTNEKLIEIIKTKRELVGIPIIANVDFGHTDPKITYPIGGLVKIAVNKTSSSLQIIEH